MKRTPEHQTVGFRKSALLLFSVALALSSALLAATPPRNEPNYDGRSLSEWLQEYVDFFNSHERRTMTDVPAAAIRHIGSDAVPCLLTWLRTHETRLGKKSWNWPATGDWPLHNLAMWGFQIIGSDAREAIPELSRWLQDPEWSYTAVSALSNIGKEGLPPVLGVLTNRDAEVRLRKHVCFVLPNLRTNALPAVPGLIQCLESTNEPLAQTAAQSLDTLQLIYGLDVKTELVKNLRDSNPVVRKAAVFGLRSLAKHLKERGIPPDPPELLELLHDPAYEVRVEATNALQIIRPEILATPPER